MTKNHKTLTNSSELRICFRSSSQIEERNKRFVGDCLVNKLDGILFIRDRLETFEDGREESMTGN
jgi:hypothetical protein